MELCNTQPYGASFNDQLKYMRGKVFFYDVDAFLKLRTNSIASEIKWHPLTLFIKSRRELSRM